jgi:hypothetical protein
MTASSRAASIRARLLVRRIALFSAFAWLSGFA